MKDTFIKQLIKVILKNRNRNNNKLKQSRLNHPTTITN